jgi:hypothetical protein
VKFSFTYLALFLFLVCSNVQAQKSDSLKTEFVKDSIKSKRAVNKLIYSSARKATILSACLPGLGQAYNHKFWKMPIIYAALGGIGYWGVTNQIKFKFYSDNLNALYDNDDNTTNTTRYTSDQLITQKRYYRKYRDMAVMTGLLVYLVNIIDANVDAHLKTFDVSDNLSLQIKPYSNFDYNTNLQAGLTLKFNFK